MSGEPVSELILRHAPWEAALRAMVSRPGAMALGSARIGSDPSRRQLLVDQLALVDRLPRGADHPPLTDWCVVCRQAEPRAVLAAIAPLASQRWVILQLSSTTPGRWEGVVFDRGTVTSLAKVQLIGPRMLNLPRDPEPPIERRAAQRWSRTIGALGEPLWRTVHDSHVLLIGCGRNGTQLAWQLAGLGVVRWTLIDPDRLGVENLDAMPGLELADVGRFKVEALAERLLASNPEMCITCHTGAVNELLDRLRSRADLIVTCVDDDTPRLAASWLSREMLAPHLEIGTAIQRGMQGRPTQQGDVRLLLPYEGCVQCVGGLRDREQTLYELAAPPGSLHRGEPIVWTDQRAGSLVHLNAVTVGAAAELWLSLLRGESGSTWLRLDAEPGGNWRIHRSAVTADEKCQLCHS